MAFTATSQIFSLIHLAGIDANLISSSRTSSLLQNIEITERHADDVIFAPT